VASPLTLASLGAGITVVMLCDDLICGDGPRSDVGALSVLAFVMMNVQVGTDRDTVNQLRKLKGVKEVYEVYAVHDIVAIVEAATMQELNELVNSEIRKITTVTSTNTMIAEKS
jgi:DNA-binding Lrp family transcriptional regulator